MPGNLGRINGAWERSFEGNCYLKLINPVVTGLYHLTEMLMRIEWNYTFMRKLFLSSKRPYICLCIYSDVTLICKK